MTIKRNDFRAINNAKQADGEGNRGGHNKNSVHTQHNCKKSTFLSVYTHTQAKQK